MLLKLYFFRFSLLILTAFLAVHFIPYEGNFPYKDIIDRYHLPQEIYSWANFDGAHYVSIAEQGYHTYEQAFFPLYPIFIKIGANFFRGNYVVAGLVISNISLFIGMVFFYRWLTNIFKKGQALWILGSLLLFPTAFFFSAVYTEGLYFAFTATSLYYLQKGNTRIAAILGIFSALTRVQGIFIGILFLLYFFNKSDSPIKNIKNVLKKHALLIFSPFVGLMTYMYYLYRTVGDPFFFFTSQPAFGAQRSDHLIFFPQVYYRYLKIFITSDHNFQYYIAVLEFVFMTLTLMCAVYLLVRSIKKRGYMNCGIALFSLAHLILPTLTGTLSSVPRYSLMALSTYVVIAHLQLKYRIMVLGACLILQFILASLFIQGYFVS